MKLKRIYTQRPKKEEEAGGLPISIYKEGNGHSIDRKTLSRRDASQNDMTPFATGEP